MDLGQQDQDLISSLLSQMTIEEKAGQLNQPPNLDIISDDDVRNGRVGTVICADSGFAGNEQQHRVRLDRVNHLQRLAVEESRLKIPLVFARDVIHGYRTVAPIPLGQAASFSPEHIEAVQRVAAEECSADGIRWAFSPMVDIGRDARWGRVAEGFGEDPYLASVLAQASVRGLQGDNLTDPRSVAACMKHFAGYGCVEGGRDYNTGEITEYTFRNVYLRPFYAAVQAGVATAMSAFNELGGLPATANPWLLKTVLRDEWAFCGPVVSDWNSVLELIEHGIAGDACSATARALMAGTDIDMASEAFVECIPDLHSRGILSMEVIDQAVARVLKLKAMLGLFESPYGAGDSGVGCQFSSVHQSTVLDLARRSIVLLENNHGLLPIRNQQNIGLFGSLASADFDLLGTWAPDGLASDVVTISEALKRAVPEGVTIHEAHAADAILSYSRNCDVAIYVCGESALRSGEANSVADIGLPAGQAEVLKALKRTGIPVVSVVLTGRPLDLTEVAEHSDAVLLAWHPGVMGGIAIAETLLGSNNPSGKLPCTFPRSTGQVPIYYNRRATGRPTDIAGRQSSRLIDLTDSPYYSFGYGLHFGSVRYDSAKVLDGKVAVEITNLGETEVEEIVQLYIRDEVSQRVRPVRELIGFARIAVSPGEKRSVELEILPESLGYYPNDSELQIEEGWFTVAVGADSNALDFARIRVDANGTWLEIQYL